MRDLALGPFGKCQQGVTRTSAAVAACEREKALKFCAGRKGKRMGRTVDST